MTRHPTMSCSTDDVWCTDVQGTAVVYAYSSPNLGIETSLVLFRPFTSTWIPLLSRTFKPAQFWFIYNKKRARSSLFTKYLSTGFLASTTNSKLGAPLQIGPWALLVFWGKRSDARQSETELQYTECQFEIPNPRSLNGLPVKLILLIPELLSYDYLFCTTKEEKTMLHFAFIKSNNALNIESSDIN